MTGFVQLLCPKMSEVLDIAPLRTSCNSREFQETIDELCAKLRGKQCCYRYCQYSLLTLVICAGSDVPEESWEEFVLQDDMEVIQLLSNAFVSAWPR